MYKYLLTILSFFILTGLQPSYAQGRMDFEEKEHDFGNIKEEDGPTEHTFTFVNKGNQPLTILDVKASCGCTTPSWSNEPIAPDAEGFITASYNPKGRPGVFNKSISVKTDGQPQMTILRIKGEVTPQPKGLRDLYGMDLGNIRVKSNHISMGNVTKGQIETGTLTLYNDSKQPIQLFPGKSTLPEHLTMRISKEVIAPADTATIIVDYNSADKNDWGFVFDYIRLATNDPLEAEKRINVSANIKEDFSSISEGDPTPTLVFETEKHNFGNISAKSKQEFTFNLTNKGNDVLILHKVKPSCGCTASDIGKKVLQPNESTTLKIVYTAPAYSGPQRKAITIISNDPKKSETTLWIEATINN
ncbi:DUF1573 domain-containing protein [Algivirga pacifica]|uniref:DUF1573 domain-containing protein n=1 Tax=Algivirga pacifica TaxID=1162670 RepID=A0ABP9D941_9BACT